MYTLFVIFLLLLLPSVGHATPADTDYAARVGATGVAASYPFDDASVSIVTSGINQNTKLDGDNILRASIDTVVKRSGAGSIRFDIIPPPHSASNPAGEWGPNYQNGRIFGKTYKPGDTFYVQHAARWSPYGLENTYGSLHSWKMNIFCYNTCTCSNLTLVGINWLNTGIPEEYSECGSKALNTNPTAPTKWVASSNPGGYLVNAGDFSCNHNTYTTDNCFHMLPNVWHTFLYRVTLGAWNTPTSHIVIKVATEKNPVYQTWMDVDDYFLRCNAQPTCTDTNEGYNTLELSGAYMTNLPGNWGNDRPWSVWFDELIISDNPIPEPNAPADQPAWRNVALGSGAASGGGVFQ